jgi:predicted GNAT family N-acyltransferase
MDNIEIIETGEDAAGRETGFTIRRAVFCDEQGVDALEEFDDADRDPATRHYLAMLRGEPVGAARLRMLDAHTAKIERVAVLRPLRKRGLGAAMMRRAIADARAAGADSIVIHAQKHAEKFYRGIGFATRGSGFVEAGITHVRMVYAGKPA